jgi:hypothetical protein
MAITLSEVRSKYPEYSDLTDQQLADSLHAKFYSDLPKPEFYAKIGMAPSVDLIGMGVEAAGRGLQNLAGTPRAIGDFAAATGQKAENKGVGPWIPNPVSVLRHLPAGSDMVQVGNQNAPQTTPQKIAAGAIEGGVSGLLFGPGGAVVGAGGGAAQTAAEAAGADPITSAVAGLAGGLGTGIASNVVNRTANIVRGQGNPTLNAMNAEGVTSNLAGTASGSRAAQMTEQGLAQTFSGSGTIKAAADRANQQIGQAVERAASTQGAATTPAEAGRVILRGLTEPATATSPGGFVARFKTEAGRLYNQLDARIPGATPSATVNTQQAVADIRNRLAGMPETAKALTPGLFGSIERDLAGGGSVTFSTLSGLRSKIGEKLADSALVSDVSRGELKTLYKALSKDLEAAAQSAGAGGTFARASNFWEAGMTRMENTLQRLADARVPEQAYTLAMSGSRQGATDLYALRRSLNPDEWGQVSSAVLRSMGRKGDDFDVGTFLSSWNRMSPEAKTALFRGPGMRDYARSVDNLATMAKSFGESATVRNRSNTSGNAYLISTLVGGSGLAYADPSSAGAALGAAVVAPWAASKLITSPTFVKWLSTPVGKNRIPAHLAGLTQVVRSEPELADAAKEFLNAVSASEP